VQTIRSALTTEPLAAPDYFEVVDADSLETIIRLRGACMILLAVHIGKTRLIDNLFVEVSDSPGADATRCVL
jgi:pantoate--beta-alanine ligase